MNGLNFTLPVGMGRLPGVAILSGFMVFSVASSAEAQSGRPNSTTMTCAQVQSMINQRGAVVLSTGQYTFDRYVANRNFCQHGEVAGKDTVPTRDNGRCYVRRCIDPQPWRYDR